MTTHDLAPRAMVIGGGIAGPATAIALTRAGCPATVYEASAAPRDSAGAFLNLAPNGIRVLERLGIERVLDGIGFANDRLIFHNESGRVLADVPVGGMTLLRGALSRALREAAEAEGVPFVFGKALERVTQDADRVVAWFADGTSVAADLLIGADGIGSRVRQSVFPEAPRPTYTGILNLGGVVQTDLASTGSAMHMVFGCRGFFGYAVRPSGETYWFSNVPEPVGPSAADLAQTTAATFRERLRQVHDGDPPEVRRILDALSDQVGVYPIADLRTLPAWHRGRVCLLGDAAHAIGPHAGQGASLGLEDALVLARCLGDGHGVSRAFATFERLRRPRVDPVVAYARRTGQRKAPSGWLSRKVRDLVLPVFLRKGAAAAQVLYQYSVVGDEAGRSGVDFTRPRSSTR